SSRWSAVAGVLPVSSLAAGVYLSILVASLFIGPRAPAPVRCLAWRAMLVLAGATAGSAIWFTVVQKWIVGALCPYCLATHALVLLLGVLVIWQARLQFRDDSTDVAPTVQDVSPSRALWRFPVIGLALAGILAACQVGIAPKAEYRSGQSQDNLPAIDPHA